MQRPSHVALEIIERTDPKNVLQLVTNAPVEEGFGGLEVCAFYLIAI